MSVQELIDKIIKYRLIIAGWTGFSCACFTPPIIKLQGTLFTTQEMSMILLIPAIIRVGQCLLTKLDDIQSLYAPVFIEILFPFTLILLFTNLKLFVACEIILGTFFMLSYNNRASRISELIKVHYNINRFSNLQMSWFSAGTVIGYTLSMFMPTWITPQMILGTVIGVGVLSLYPIFVTNKLVLKVSVMEPVEA